MRLGIVLFLLLGFQLSESANAQDAPSIPVHFVAKQKVREILEFPARVYAGEAIKIIPRVEGNLLERPVLSGSSVAAGDLLYLIQPKPFELAKEAAEAAVEQARAKLEFAEKTLARAETLTSKDVLPQQRMDEYQSDYEVALTTLTTAERALENANLQLGYTRITAKYDGVLTNLEIALNDLVGPNRGAVGRLDIVDVVRVFIHIDQNLDTQYYQRQLRGEEIDFDIRFRFSSGEIYSEKGEVFAWDNEIDTRTGTRTVKLKFENPDLLLTPGMTGTVQVSEVTEDGVLAIPLELVQQDQLGRYVLVVGDDNVLRQQHVTLGAQVDNWWIVTEGLDGGEQIVAGALQRVRPGMTISPVTQAD